MSNDAGFSASTPEAQALDEVFTKRMADLQAGVEHNGSSLRTGTTKWIEMYSDKPGTTEPDGPGKVLNGFDDEEFIAAFKRDELNKRYIRTVQPTGDAAPSYRDAQMLKVQIDLMAWYERELRMRYRSRARMLVHGTARLMSHGLSVGPINKGIVNFVKLLMDHR